MTAPRKKTTGTPFLIALLLTAVADAQGQTPGLDATALTQPAHTQSNSLLFKELKSSLSGISFRNDWLAPAAMESVRTLSFAGGGVAMGDFDGDGLTDVYMSRPFGGGKLFRNLGGFKFSDATEAAQLGAKDKSFWEAGCSWADIDNDGDLDLSVCAFHGSNRLYLNTDGKFRDVAEEAGINFVGASVIMAFSDYDRDGDLDAYLVTNRAFSPTNAFDVTSREVAQKVFPQLQKDASGAVIGMPDHLKEVFDLQWNPERQINMFIRAGQYDRLFRNDGAAQKGGVPRFTDVTGEAGLKHNGMGLSATWWDYDDDGFPDLYVANDYFGQDKFYRNLGNGKFEDIAESALPHTPWYSMGTNVEDINNDGLLDFMGTDMSGTNHFLQKIGMGDMSKNAWFLDSAEPRQYMRNAVYVNSGTGRFMEAAHLTGLANSDWTWAIKFGDLDNDGYSDLFIANGMTGDLFNSDTLNAQRSDPSLKAVKPEVKRDANLAFKNLGDLKFANKGAEWGLNKQAVCFGAALGDLDNDGDQDLVVNQFEGEALVYRNDAAGRDGSNSIRVRLVGTKSNRWGIDAKVRIETSAGSQTRLLTLSRGFYSSDEPVLHFGLGNATMIERLTVDWPSGTVQQFKHLPTGKLYTITEAETSNAQPFRERRHSSEPLFAETDKWLSAEQTERAFDDYARQPLLPNKSSQLGPGHAWGDIDGDGDDDLYFTGSKGVPGRIYFREGDRFVIRTFAPFDAEEDANAEDMAPVFFDADGDGDLDLYVVSGGVECEPGDASLQDRLYLNDGKGAFKRAVNSLPAVLNSGSVVCAADVDRDGDIDLFVGGRIVPGRYPETPTSQLLINNGSGVFKDETPEPLRGTGLVTSALWSDIDNDGWLDLLVTHEWGPVKTFRNSNGTLTDVTPVTGIAQFTGWWNSITGTDIDGDGDIDYAIGNFGLNTKYHASIDHPTLLYYGDVENQGRPSIIEAGYEDETCYPLRGRSCSSSAMPSLAERFTTFKSFAAATLEQVYDPKNLAQAHKLAATTLTSGILINTTEPGQMPTFRFQPLPGIAQIAPVFGIAFTEANGDGHPDLILAQNFYGPQRETGQMDGGVSLLLLGDGTANFTPVWPDQSGISIGKDATALTTADFNHDGMPDLFFGINSGTQVVLQHQGSPESFLSLRLPHHAHPGSRVTVRMKDGSTQTSETYTGGGYLSQSPSLLFFGLGNHDAGSVEGISIESASGTKSFSFDQLTRKGGSSIIP
ncbi:MAG: VCBS repeat-containing protein [Verrucomicrobiae bacterium]|nr:VCBS repeat-containing protein [Verrucomicrobiae bacterium]